MESGRYVEVLMHIYIFMRCMLYTCYIYHIYSDRSVCVVEQRFYCIYIYIYMKCQMYICYHVYAIYIVRPDMMAESINHRLTMQKVRGSIRSRVKRMI